jgi:cell wall-associated NlpC family hydrolase
MRATRFCLLVLIAFAFAAPALASGPVFVVVPTTPAEVRESAPTQPPASAGGSELQQELRAERHALAQARLTVRRLRAAVVSQHSANVSSLGLSGWLEADKRSVQLSLAEESAVARRERLRQRIAALEREARPAPAPPAGDLPMPTFATPVGAEAVSIAEQYLGVPYRWGGSTPAGFDCSGLTMYVYAQLGIQLPHYAATQWSQGPPVDPYSLEPGDLVFFEPGLDGPGHVAIYIGGGEIIEAPHTGDVVKLASLSETAATLGFVGAVRPASAVAPLFP